MSPPEAYFFCRILRIAVLLLCMLLLMIVPIIVVVDSTSTTAASQLKKNVTTTTKKKATTTTNRLLPTKAPASKNQNKNNKATTTNTAGTSNNGDDNNNNNINNSKADAQPRIVGGTPVADGTYPSYAVTAGTKLCGGTVIYEDIILTAAHCLTDAWAAGALIGGTTIDGQSSEFIAVDSSNPHPSYHATDPNDESYDVMLIKLSSPTSAPIQALNLDPNAPADGETLTVIGYGNTEENGSSSDVLLGVDVPAVGQTDCEAFWGPSTVNQDVMLCAGGQGGVDSCQGDSGGPIMTSSGVQVGVVSFSNGCGQPGIPAIYAKISGVQDFISQGICDLSSNPPACCATDTCSTTSTGTTPVPSPSINSTPVPSTGGGGTTPQPSPTTAATPTPTPAPLAGATPAPSASTGIGSTPTPSVAAGIGSTPTPTAMSPVITTTTTNQPTAAVTQPLVTQQPSTTAVSIPAPIRVPTATAPSKRTPVPTGSNGIADDIPTAQPFATLVPTDESTNTRFICFCDDDNDNDSNASLPSKNQSIMMSGKGGKGNKSRRLKKSSSRRKKNRRRRRKKKTKKFSKYSSSSSQQRPSPDDDDEEEGNEADYTVSDPTSCYCRPAYLFDPPRTDNDYLSTTADRLRLIQFQQMFGQHDNDEDWAYGNNRLTSNNDNNNRKRRKKANRNINNNNIFHRDDDGDERNNNKPQDADRGIPISELRQNGSNRNNNNEQNNEEDDGDTNNALTNVLAKVLHHFRTKRQTRIGVLTNENGRRKYYYDEGNDDAKEQQKRPRTSHLLKHNIQN